MKKTIKGIFTADLHGNKAQYEKLFDKARGVDFAVIGGDITPPGGIDEQRKFIENELIRLIADFKSKHKNVDIYLMLGNDDWVSNMQVLARENNRLYKIIHNQVYKLNEDFNLVGYSYVPITPFAIKDFEKFDSKDPQLQKGVTLQGFKSSGFELLPFKFNPEDREDNIENDFKNILRLSEPAKTIYAIHTPPYNTNLDMVYAAVHVGSLAVRRFIEQQRPYLTLHGHIHETIEVSNHFRDKINGVICLGVGNNAHEKGLAVITFDLYDLNSIKREVL